MYKTEGFVVLGLLLILFVCAMLFMQGENYCDGRLKILNRTPTPVVFEAEQDSVFHSNSHSQVAYYIPGAITAPGDSTSKCCFDSRDCWPDVVTEHRPLFVFNADSLDAYYSFDSLLLKGQYCRLVVTRAELECSNWHIVVTEPPPGNLSNPNPHL